MEIPDPLLIGALAFVSAFMAGSEIALFSLSRFQLRAIRDRARAVHAKIERLRSDPAGLLLTILVTNEIVNIWLSSRIASLVLREDNPPPILLGWAPPPELWDALLSAAVTAPIVLIFCEVTPKLVGMQANRVVAPFSAHVLLVLYRVLTPVRAVIRSLSAQAAGERSGALQENEVILLAEEGHREGTIREGELELIRNVFEFDDVPVSEVSTPASRLQILSATTTVREALSTVRLHGFSRYPVYGGSRRRIVGVVYAKDLLRAKLVEAGREASPRTVADVMRKPLVVAPDASLSTTFRRLKQARTHLAVLQGSNGEFQGIVTMNDVLEALFEESVQP